MPSRTCGGQEMGRRWYDDGHLLNKKNSFTDFIDVTRYLVAQKYAGAGARCGAGQRGRAADGRRREHGAAGLCADRGAGALRRRGDDDAGRLDPAHANEYDEWGNPAEKKYYDYMLSYSPYDQVQAKAYARYVGTGLWDSQVQYFEPAKWVAKLREMNQQLFYRLPRQHGGGARRQVGPVRTLQAGGGMAGVPAAAAERGEIGR
ncbi:prolyl oligopeptidase family serine peptidase [Sphingomonas sp. MMS24-JH45]